MTCASEAVELIGRQSLFIPFAGCQAFRVSRHVELRPSTFHGLFHAILSLLLVCLSVYFYPFDDTSLSIAHVTNRRHDITESPPSRDLPPLLHPRRCLGHHTRRRSLDCKSHTQRGMERFGEYAQNRGSRFIPTFSLRRRKRRG